MVMRQEDRDEIAEAVRLLEEKTSVEIVPVFVSEASRYGTYFLLWALCQALVQAPLIFYVLESSSWFAIDTTWWSPLSLQMISLGLSLILAFGFLSLTRFSFVAKWALRLVPRWMKHEAVENRARDIFLEREVFATPGRTGLLLLICQQEHMIFLLPDRGLVKVFTDDVLRELTRGLVEDFSSRKPTVHFLHTLKRLEPLLVEDFPAEDQPKNQLPNEVVMSQPI